MPPKAAKKKMAAITTIPNPINPDKLMFFTSNPNFTLGYESRAIKDHKGSGVIGYTADTPAPPGPILTSPSTLTSFINQDAISVYGVVEAGTDLNIALISPVYNKLDIDDVTNGHLAGCIDAENSIFLYYQGTSGGSSQIVEKDITGSSGGVLKKIKDFSTETRLASTFDGEHKWLIYQDSDSNIGVYNSTNHTVETISGSDNFATDQTNIGVCAIPSDASAGRPNKRLYVYFTNKQKKLYRAWSEIKDGAVFPGKQSDIQQIGSDAVFELSQISVYPDAERKRNLIYVFKSNGNSVGVIEDKWSAK